MLVKPCLPVCLQAHLVAAFEKSLSNMTCRLQSLTMTAEQKVITYTTHEPHGEGVLGRIHGWIFVCLQGSVPASGFKCFHISFLQTIPHYKVYFSRFSYKLPFLYTDHTEALCVKIQPYHKL